MIMDGSSHIMDFSTWKQLKMFNEKLINLRTAVHLGSHILDNYTWKEQLKLPEGSKPIELTPKQSSLIDVEFAAVK